MTALLREWKGLRDIARGWQSRRLSARAEEILSRNELHSAFDIAKSAYYLKPDELSAIRAGARVLDAADRPAEALVFWRKAVASPHATTMDKLALAADLLKTGALVEAESAVATLQEPEPKSPAVLRLAAQLAAARGRVADGLALVNESLDLDPENAEGRLLAAIFLADSEEERDRKAALESLWALSANAGPPGLRALLRLAECKDLSEEQALELASRLRERPVSGERLRLLALDVLLRVQSDRGQVLDSAMTEYLTKSAEARREFGVWLNARSECRRTLAVLPEAESLTRKDLLLVHLDALAALGQWQDVRRHLEQRNVPLEEIYRQVLLARCTSKEGDSVQAQVHWRRARTEASGKPKLLWFVGDFAERSGEWDQAEQTYRALIRDSVASRPAFDALLRVVSGRRDTRSVRDVLAEMRVQFPQDDAVENDLAYFNLLLGENVQEARDSAEKLRSVAPHNLAHRTTLALALCRLKQPLEALEAYEGIRVPWSIVPPGQRAIRAATLAMNGDTDGAAAEIATISLEALRIEERQLIEPWIAQ